MGQHAKPIMAMCSSGSWVRLLSAYIYIYIYIYMLFYWYDGNVHCFAHEGLMANLFLCICVTDA